MSATLRSFFVLTTSPTIPVVMGIVIILPVCQHEVRKSQQHSASRRLQSRSVRHGMSSCRSTSVDLRMHRNQRDRRHIDLRLRLREEGEKEREASLHSYRTSLFQHHSDSCSTKQKKGVALSRPHLDFPLVVRRYFGPQLSLLLVHEE